MMETWQQIHLADPRYLGHYGLLLLVNSIIAVIWRLDRGQNHVKN